MDITMIIVFAVINISLGILFLFSKGQYDEFVEDLDKKEHQLKILYPIAFYILNKFHYTFQTVYDRGLLNKIAELKGVRYANYYLKIHWVNKLSYSFLLLEIFSIFGLIIGPDPAILVFGVIAPIGVFFLLDKKLIDNVTKRRMEIMMDFPDFINKLTLLISAGMTVLKAWEVTITGSKNKEGRPLYDEVSQVLKEVKAGKSEIQAYEDFAKRCKIPEIMKFISVVIQNLKKGNSELVIILKFQAQDCWEMRKNAAKRLGEEASTKMLLPMMIMFLAILIIVATPALLSLNSGF